MAAPPARRRGVALPTAIAAVVCGGSVLGMAVTGAFMLEGGGDRSPSVRIVGASEVAPGAVSPSVTRRLPVSPVPPPGEVGPGPLPVLASTASEYSVTISSR